LRSQGPERLDLLSGSGAIKPAFQFRSMFFVTGELPRSDIVHEEIHPDLMIDGLAEGARVGAGLTVLDDLLRRQGQQHADNDDPYFTGKSAPTMQRLRQLQMHETGPPTASYADSGETPNFGNGSIADISLGIGPTPVD